MIVYSTFYDEYENDCINDDSGNDKYMRTIMINYRNSDMMKIRITILNWGNN